MRSSLLLAVSLLLAAGCKGPPEAPPGPRRNVVFIVVDDLNTALSVYGNPVVRTPNFERLAAHGVVFEHAYSQFPLCSPSRTSFLSGRLPQTTGILDQKTPPRAVLGDAAFLPDVFRAAGFFTLRAGKMLHGNKYETAIQWDAEGKFNLPLTRRAPHRFRRPSPEVLADPKAAEPVSWSRDHAVVEADAAEGLNRLLSPQGVSGLAEENLRDRFVVDETVRYLRERKKDAQPFFFAVGLHRPHVPLILPERFLQMYQPADIPLPPVAAADAPPLPPRALRGLAVGPQIEPGQAQQAIANYYAAVSYIDAELGTLLDALDRLELWDDTVVVLLSDHGFHLGEHGGLWGKLSLFEESARVPLLIAAPGLSPGGRSTRTVELVDLFPTVVELAGLRPPAGLEGRSLVPLLRDPSAPWEHPARTWLAPKRKDAGEAISIRTERFRYTEWRGPAQAELYDHDNDPFELWNRVSDPAYADDKRRLHRLLVEVAGR